MKEIRSTLKLNLPAGKVNPAIIGKDLASSGINLVQFCSQYNELTKNNIGEIIPAKIIIYDDRTFSIRTTEPPTAFLIKQALGVKKGAGKTGHEMIGSLTEEQIKKLQKEKWLI